MNRLLLLLPLALLFPTAAHAAPTGTHCGTDGTCYLIEPGDTYTSTTAFTPLTGYMDTGTGKATRSGEGCSSTWQTKEAWVRAGSPRTAGVCVIVGTTSVVHYFSRLKHAVPEADRWAFRPWSTLWVSEEIVEGTVVHTSARAEHGIGSQMAEYCGFYTVPGEHLVALERTPDVIYGGCGFLRRQGAAVTTPAPATQTIAVPASAARCGSVGKVTVRSLRMACAPARAIIARYARSLRSPAGWACRAVVTDAGRRASCTRLARAKVARATVYGIWRP